MNVCKGNVMLFDTNTINAIDKFFDNLLCFAFLNWISLTSWKNKGEGHSVPSG
jgi:hypothetical protein